jgi:heat shock protein HslJ
MSELRADTITASNGTGPVTLTKQSAAKAWFFTTDKTTHVPDNSLNISTITDNDPGRPEANFTNNFNDTFIAAAGDGGNNRFVSNYTTDGGITTSTFAHSMTSSSGSIADVAATGVGLGLQYNGDLA